MAAAAARRPRPAAESVRAERRLHEQLADLGHAAARVEHGGAAGRIEVELAARSPGWRAGGACTRTSESRARRSAAPAPAPRSRVRVPWVSSTRQVGVDGARHRERQVRVRPRGRWGCWSSPRPRKRAIVARAGAVPWPLSASVCPAARVVHEGHALTAERVGGGRLHHGGREAGGHRGVEGIAAREQHAHAGHRDQRVAGGDDALGAGDDRARGRPVRRRGAPSRGYVRSVGSWARAPWERINHARCGTSTAICADVRLDRPRARR